MHSPKVLQPAPRTDEVDPDWPLGRPADVSAPAADDGFIFDRASTDDFFALFQKLIRDSGITPNETSDNSVNNQIYDAFRLLFPSFNRRYPIGYITGLSFESVGIGAMTFKQGHCAIQVPPPTVALTGDTDIDNLAPLTKDTTGAVWSSGGGGGVKPAGLTFGVSKWHAVWIVMRNVAGPGGAARTIDITLATFANPTFPIDFFADAAAIAEGFTDNKLARRIGYAKTDPTGLGLLETESHFRDARQVRYMNPRQAIISTAVESNPVNPPTVLTLPDVPFGVYALLTIYARSSSGTESRVTLAGFGNDYPPGSGDSVPFDIIIPAGSGTSVSGTVKGQWKTDGLQQLRARTDQAGVTITIQIDGWIDPAIVEV